jgi:hypothetical protein
MVRLILMVNVLDGVSSIKMCSAVQLSIAFKKASSWFTAVVSSGPYMLLRLLPVKTFQTNWNGAKKRRPRDLLTRPKV